MSGIKQGIIVIVVLLLVFGVLGCVTASPSSTATPTEQPTAVQPTEVQPTAAVPAAPTSNAPYTQSQLNTITQTIEAGGYTVVDPMVRNTTTQLGYPVYEGTFTDSNGTMYRDILIQTDSPSHATTELATQIANFQAEGFTGSSSGGYWVGTTTASSGNTMGISLSASGNDVYVVLAE